MEPPRPLNGRGGVFCCAFCFDGVLTSPNIFGGGRPFEGMFYVRMLKHNVVSNIQ